jgi:acetyl-CoA C-acetyltransferase
MAARRARQLRIQPLASLRAACTAGIEPEVMGLGPARAIPGALLAAGLTFMDIDYFELNEAFAAQYLGVERMLEQECGFQLDRQNVNRNGSGIALGHPVGCSGLRVVVSLVHEMMKTGEALGCASLCAGGGPAMAAIIERI